MSTFSLPDLGEGLQDAQIVSWHVSVGDHIVTDQPLVSVETEKAVVEIPSPQAGQIAHIYGQVGDVVAVGSPLVRFNDDDQRSSESVVGELPHSPPSVNTATVYARAPVSRPVQHHGPRVRAAPAVRRLARERGVDLNAITGSGPQGAITSHDVENYQRQSWPDSGPRSAIAGEALSGTRRAMAAAMTRAGAQVVPASVNADADVTNWRCGDDPMVRLIQATVAGCAAEPSLNAWYDAQLGERVLHTQVDMGIAVDTNHGLVVPVLPNAQALSSAKIREAVDHLTRQTHARTINIKALKGQTITLSNFGPLAGRYANLVVMPPQVAIIGAGTLSDQIVAHNGAPAIRRILPLSLTFDHRVVTGGEAARFLQTMIDSLERQEPPS